MAALFAALPALDGDAATLAESVSLAPEKKKGKRTATTARGGAPACGGAITDSLASPAPASGAQTRGRGKKQLMVVPVGTLEHMWQLLQGLKKIKNSRGASVIWRNGLAIM